MCLTQKTWNLQFYIIKYISVKSCPIRTDRTDTMKRKHIFYKVRNVSHDLLDTWFFSPPFSSSACFSVVFWLGGARQHLRYLGEWWGWTCMRQWAQVDVLIAWTLMPYACQDNMAMLQEFLPPDPDPVGSLISSYCKQWYVRNLWSAF